MKINNHYEINPFGNPLDSLFSLLTNPPPISHNKEHLPYDVHERVKFRSEDTNIRIEFLAPGFKKTELSLVLDQDKLSLKSNTRKKRTSTGLFQTDEINIEVSLSQNLDIENTKAKLEEGVLTVVIPKIENQADRKIKIS